MVKVDRAQDEPEVDAEIAGDLKRHPPALVGVDDGRNPVVGGVFQVFSGLPRLIPIIPFVFVQEFTQRRLGLHKTAQLEGPRGQVL